MEGTCCKTQVIAVTGLVLSFRQLFLRSEAEHPHRS